MPIYKTFIFSWINLKTISLTMFFNKTFWLPYWPNYIINLTCFFFVYMPTYLTVNLLTYIFTYLPTHLHVHLFIYLPTYPPTYAPTYLSFYTILMFTNVWFTKYEGIALNELITIFIIFDPLMSIKNNLECGYCTLDQLLWPTCRYYIFWQLLFKAEIVEDLIGKYNTHTWKQCHFKYNAPQ
jgi:hypothetical protein